MDYHSPPVWRKYRNYVNVKWTSGCHLRDYRPYFRKEKPPETLISQRFRGSHHHRGDKIRTCGLRVPNAALYQTEPRLDLYLLLRTNRSKQMLSYLIFTEASSPVLFFTFFRMSGSPVLHCQSSVCVLLDHKCNHSGEHLRAGNCNPHTVQSHLQGKKQASG